MKNDVIFSFKTYNLKNNDDEKKNYLDSVSVIIFKKNEIIKYLL